MVFNMCGMMRPTNPMGPVILTATPIAMETEMSKMVFIFFTSIPFKNAFS